MSSSSAFTYTMCRILRVMAYLHPQPILILMAESYPNSAALDRVMHACCDNRLQVPAACPAEDKLITQACTFLSCYGDTDLFARKFWPFTQLFMQGRFMLSVMVVNGINCIWRDVRRSMRELKYPESCCSRYCVSQVLTRQACMRLKVRFK